MALKNQITFKIYGESKDLSVKLFLKSINEFVHIIKSVGKNITESNEFIDCRIIDIKKENPFTVTMGTGSAIEPNLSSRIINSCLLGINQIELNPKMPNFFDLKTIRHAKELVSLLNDGVDRFEFYYEDNEPIKPTQHLAVNADVITKRLNKQTFAWISIEGLLDFADIHGKYEFKIFDIMTDESVKCIFSEELFAKAKSALGKRVLLKGEGRYNKDYKLISLKVDEISIYKDDNLFPSLDDIKGIDITGGLGIDKYLMEIENAREY